MTIASHNMHPIQTSTVRHLFGQALPSMRQDPLFEVTYERQAFLLSSTHTSAEAPVVSLR